MHMDLSEFTQAINRMSDADIRMIASELHVRMASTADEVAWWQATIAIDRSLKGCRLHRAAAMAAGSASQAVRNVAEHAGVALPDNDVTCVARAAAEVARGIVAGPMAAQPVAHLLEGWSQVLSRVALIPA
jgi:hypothetical protein